MAVRVDTAALARALDQVRPAVSHDRKRPVLQGVLVEVGGGVVRLVATDAARLHAAEVRLAGDDEWRAVVSPSALEGVSELDPEALDTVAGEFPAYQPFLAGHPRAHTLVVDRDAFLDAVEGTDDDRPMAVRFVAGAVELGGARVAAVYDGPDVAFVINPGFAHDAASAVSGAELAIDAADATSPVVIRAAAHDEGFTAVIMPVRVAEPRRRRST